MAHKISIEGVADFSSILKEAKDLQTSVSNMFGQDGAKIFDESSISFLQKQSKEFFGSISNEIKKLKSEARELDALLAQGDSDAGVSKKRLENIKQITELEKTLAGLKKSQSALEISTDMSVLSAAIDDALKGKTLDLGGSITQARQIDDILSNIASVEVAGVLDEVEKLKKENLKIERSIKNSTKDLSKQETLTKQRLANLRKIDALEESISDSLGGTAPVATPSSQALVPVPSKRGRRQEVVPQEVGPQRGQVIAATARQIGSQLASVGSALPGVSQAVSVGQAGISAGSAAGAVGMSGPAIAGMAVLATAAAAAGVAINRMMSGFEVFTSAIPNLLSISGMESDPMQGGPIRREAAQMGYDQLQLLDFQKSALQAMGNTATPGEERNRLSNIMTASRDLGMDPQQIIGGANQLRQAGGTEVGQRQIAAILEKAITSGMDKSQASNFLNAAVGMLASLNQSGTANTSAMLDVMSDLVTNNNMSAEQAAKSLQGLNAAISGSSGESNAFFQVAASREGLGGGTLAGTSFAVRQGLMGVNAGDLSKQVGDTESGRMGMRAISEMGLDDPAYTQKFASGMLEQMRSRFGGMDSREGRAGALGFTAETFGVKTAGEATKVLALLEKMSKGAGMSKDDQTLLKSLGQDPEAEWRGRVLDKLDATARAVADAAANMKNGQFDLGQASSGLITTLNGYLNQLDMTLIKLLSGNVFDGLDDVMINMKAFGQTIDHIFTEVTKTIAGAFEGLRLDGLKDLFKDMLGDPAGFGKSMGIGFTELVQSMWDTLLGSVKQLVLFIADNLLMPLGIIKEEDRDEFYKKVNKTFGTADETADRAGLPYLGEAYDKYSGKPNVNTTRIDEMLKKNLPESARPANSAPATASQPTPTINVVADSNPAHLTELQKQTEYLKQMSQKKPGLPPNVTSSQK